MQANMQRKILWALILGLLLVLPHPLHQDVFDAPTATVAPNPPLAQGIPWQQTADEQIIDFKYLFISDGEKKWKIEAEEALFYQKEKIVHAKKAFATFFEKNNRKTYVRGLEAKYHIGQKDIELYGKVKTQLSDGDFLESEFLYYSVEQKKIMIPKPYWTKGHSGQGKYPPITFKSVGFAYPLEGEIIELYEQVLFCLSTPAQDLVHPPTRVVADSAKVFRSKQKASFLSKENSRVKLTQANLKLQCKTADLHFGEAPTLVHAVVAMGNVLIQEIDSLKHATAGKALFNNQNQTMILEQYPRIYQGNSIVVGDTILVHRDTGVVEIEQSNTIRKE